MRKRICLYGGPGCGKSTLAANIYSSLKVKGYNIELIQEWIKTWAYQNRRPRSFEQLYVFTKQLNKEDTLLTHVDYLVTDSPVFMNVVYAELDQFDCSSSLKEIALTYEKKHPGIHIFLDRGDLEYKQVGRYHNLDQARDLDSLIELMIKDHIPYKKIASTDFEAILEYINSQLS